MARPKPKKNPPPLARARIGAGLTQREFAAALKISAVSYSQRELGVVRVTVGEALRMAAILGTPVEQLFSRNAR